MKYISYLCNKKRKQLKLTTMVNLEVKLSLYNDLVFPNYVWVNDEGENEREGYEYVNVSVNDDDYDTFIDFLEYNKEVVISYEVY